MLELIRIILLLIMFGVTSYLDLKHREVSDKYWLIFGGMGIIIYFFDWQEHNSYDVLTIIITLFFAVFLWKYFPIGKADILTAVCAGILVPTILEFVMVPIALFLGGAILAGICTILYNIILNTKDGIGMKRNPFYTFDESIIRKILAFFMIHKKRDREKFSICAENTISGKKKFCLGIKNPESEFTKNSIFVECGTPMIPYMFVMCILLVFASF